MTPGAFARPSSFASTVWRARRTSPFAVGVVAQVREQQLDPAAATPSRPSPPPLLTASRQA